MVAFLALLAKPAVTGLIKWGMGCAVAYFTAKPLVEKWGSTPANNLARNGIPEEQQYEDHKKWLADRKKYIEDKTDELFKDLKDRRDNLEEENKKLTRRLENASPEDKAKFLEMIADNKREISSINKTIAEEINKLTKNFETLGNTPLTYQQFQDKSKQTDLTSWWNWGIIVFCVVIAIILISFVKKILSKIASSVG